MFRKQNTILSVWHSIFVLDFSEILDFILKHCVMYVTFIKTKTHIHSITQRNSLASSLFNT